VHFKNIQSFFHNSRMCQTYGDNVTTDRTSFDLISFDITAVNVLNRRHANLHAAKTFCFISDTSSHWLSGKKDC